MRSFWQSLKPSLHFDMLIIGAGFTGLHAAIAFKKKNPQARVCILDRAFGIKAASVRNAGFACFGSPSELLADIARMGTENALELLEKRRKGIRYLQKHYAKSSEFIPATGYEWFGEDQQNLWMKVVANIDDLNKQIGATQQGYIYKIDKGKHQHRLAGICEIAGEGQINPAALHAALMQKASGLGIQFLEGKLDDDCVDFEARSVNLQHITIGYGHLLWANNGFYKRSNTPTVQPGRAQVLITEPLPDIPFMGNYHMQEGYYYFRNVGKRLLLGGGRHLAVEEETTTEFALNQIIQDQLDKVLGWLLLGSKPKVEHRWAGIMGMRSDKKPVVEYLSDTESAIVGLSGMGVALAPILANEWANTMTIS